MKKVVELVSSKIEELKKNGTKHTEAVRMVNREMYSDMSNLSKKDLKELDYWVWVCNAAKGSHWTVSDKVFYTDEPMPTMNPWLLIAYAISPRVTVMGVLSQDQLDNEPDRFPFAVNCSMKDAAVVYIGQFENKGYDLSNIMETKEVAKLELNPEWVVEEKQKAIADFMDEAFCNIPIYRGEERVLMSLGRDDFRFWKSVVRDLPVEALCTAYEGGLPEIFWAGNDRTGNAVTINVGTAVVEEEFGPKTKLYSGRRNTDMVVVQVRYMEEEDGTPVEKENFDIVIHTDRNMEEVELHDFIVEKVSEVISTALN